MDCNLNASVNFADFFRGGGGSRNLFSMLISRYFEFIRKLSHTLEEII